MFLCNRNIIYVYYTHKHILQRVDWGTPFQFSWQESRECPAGVLPCATCQRELVASPGHSNKWLGRKKDVWFLRMLCKGNFRSCSDCLVQRHWRCANATRGPHLTLDAPGFLYTLSSPRVPGWQLCFTAWNTGAGSWRSGFAFSFHLTQL